MKRPVRVDSKELARELSLLGDESRDGLVQRWTDSMGPLQLHHDGVQYGVE